MFRIAKDDPEKVECQRKPAYLALDILAPWLPPRLQIFASNSSPKLQRPKNGIQDSPPSSIFWKTSCHHILSGDRHQSVPSPGCDLSGLNHKHTILQGFPRKIVYICNLKCEPSLNHSLDGQQLINPGLAFCSTNRRSGCSQTLIFFCLNGCEIVQLCVRWSCVSTTCVNRLLFF